MGVSFPFSLVFSRLFVQLFVKVSQTIVLPLAFLNLWDGFGHCLLYSVMSFYPWYVSLVAINVPY